MSGQQHSFSISCPTGSAKAARKAQSSSPAQGAHYLCVTTGKTPAVPPPTIPQNTHPHSHTPPYPHTNMHTRTSCRPAPGWSL